MRSHHNNPLKPFTIVSTSLLIFSTISVIASDCSKTSVGLTPLNDLGAAFYKGKQGGFYPNGDNVRPASHEAAGLDLAQAVRPLDSQGRPDDNGRVVFVSIGMSNTTQEFSTFKPIADTDPDKNPKLVIVDGAQGGMSADEIFDLNTPNAQQFWTVVDTRLRAAGVSNAQVQAAWIKQADKQPNLAFPADAMKLKDEMAAIARILKARFQNIKLAYWSSRTYAGYASTTLNPEPFAYQSGFAVKWLIEDQINGSPDLNYDSARGAVKAPWLAWGPYLWADGTTPRSDGLIYVCSDFVSDGTHPAPGGARDKVARMLLDFLKSDATARQWFLDVKTDTAPPIVHVTSPNGGERYHPGDTLAIDWNAADDTAVVSQDILLSIDKGRSFSITVAAGLSGGMRSFTWTIPMDGVTGKSRIRVISRDAAGNSAQDDSDGNFKIK